MQVQYFRLPPRCHCGEYTTPLKKGLKEIEVESSIGFYRIKPVYYCKKCKEFSHFIFYWIPGNRPIAEKIKAKDKGGLEKEVEKKVREIVKKHGRIFIAGF